MSSDGHNRGNGRPNLELTLHTNARKRAFLTAYIEMRGQLGKAAMAAEVDRTTVWQWRQDDEAFAKAYDEAGEIGHEGLVAEAWRRAEDGVDEYVVSAGKLVMDPDDPTRPLKQRRFSDALIKFLIERREGKPTQRIEHSAVSKPKEVSPVYVAEVLAELDRRHALAPGESSD